ncbi:MAG: hypothetical protein HYY02_02185 [Chloroflexi bacterium]|nr:hypothetical protein [Chloroflexota bacterium]
MQLLHRRRLVPYPHSLLLFMLSAMVALACAPSPSPGDGAGAPGAATQVKKGGSLKIGTAGQPTSLDPQIGGGGGDHKYLFAMFDTLVTYDNDSKPDPKLSLAESWSFKNDTTIEFKVRKGVKFHDGAEINAEVIKWNGAGAGPQGPGHWPRRPAGG